MSLNLFPTSVFSRNLSSHPLFSMQREMNKLFEDAVGDDSLNSSLNNVSKALAPRMDIVEDEKSFHLTAELPGVEEKDIHLVVKNGLLSISAEKKATHEKNEKGRHYVERTYGKFERSVSIGEDIDEDGIEAGFKNGVLNVILPKKEPAKPTEKKIEVKSN